MDIATQQAIAADLATLVNPINTFTNQPWTASEMYEYTESLIAQRQGTGQEAISNRIADASANGYREMSVGEKGYLSGPYLHRAAAAGLLRKQMNVTNAQVITLISYQSALVTLKSTLALIEGEFALAETIKDELDNDIASPAFVAATESYNGALALLDNVSNDDWKLLGQRFSGSAIDDTNELLIAVINIIHSESALKLFIESETDLKVDKRKSFEDSKALAVEVLMPAAIDFEPL